MCNFVQFLAIVLVNVLSTGIEIQIIDYFYKNLASLHHVLLCKEIASEVFFSNFTLVRGQGIYIKSTL